MSATKIQSEVKTIKSSAQEIFTFLSDFNHLQELLPEDKISEWTSSFDECSFKIQSAATIPLIKESVEEFTTINIVSGPKAPFPFTLVVHIKDLENGSCEGYLLFEGQINAFLKMMVVQPLTNLFNYMAQKLEAKFEA